MIFWRVLDDKLYAIDEVDKLIEKIANAEEKLKVLKEFE